jgi:hypothetical protein
MHCTVWNHDLSRFRRLILIAAIVLLAISGCAKDEDSSDELVYTLPATGQVSCYDEVGTVIDCVGTGQDAAHVVNAMSFTDNADGTVTDEVTGLVWQQTDDDTLYDHDAAVLYCTNLALAGLSNWRLPEISELTNIASFGANTPGIDQTAFPGTDDFYWSATISSLNSAWAWLINHTNNIVDTYDRTTARLVRCVSGSAPAALAYTDQGDGTVVSTVTGLTWQQEDNNTFYTWEDALAYCNNLVLAEKTDWRLPNVKELASLLLRSGYAPAISEAYFPNTDNLRYWSSTSNDGTNDNAHTVSFANSLVGYWDKTLLEMYVRCVR